MGYHLAGSYLFVESGYHTASFIGFLLGESAFRLEKKIYKKGEWQDVAYKISDFGFDDIAYTAGKGSPVFWKADWDWLYGTLKPGTYRIVKTFYENAQNSREAFWTLSAKFRIEP